MGEVLHLADYKKQVGEITAYECACGGVLFYLTDEGAICADCGEVQGEQSER